MKTINKKIATILTTTAIFSFTLTGCASHSATSNKQTTANKQITVSYTLKEGKKALDSKKIKLPKKNPKIMNGLQKGWKVKQTKGFITSIDGKSQNPKKKIYWTYTINGKWAKKGAAEQNVKNNDKVKFTLDKVKN